MLAMKNKNGMVEGSIPGLADMARLSVEDTVAALEILRGPDPYSRTKEFEGRRIEDVEGGWCVLNHEKWRQKMNADERREYLKIKQREHREKVNKASTSVNTRKQKSTLSTHTDAYTDTDADITSANADVGAKGSHPASKSDSDWLSELSKDKTYSGIDVSREHGKMLNWCRTNQKQPTRRRFVNWLNRTDKPMTGNNGHTKPKYEVI